MIHVKKSKIDQEKAELWRVEVPLRFICTTLYLHFHHPLFAVKIYRPNSGFRFLGNILKCHLHYEFHLYISILSTRHLVTIIEISSSPQINLHIAMHQRKTNESEVESIVWTLFLFLNTSKRADSPKTKTTPHLRQFYCKDNRLFQLWQRRLP